MTKLGFYILIWTIFSIISVLSHIHKHMSPDQLQSIFYVTDHNQVPDYELVSFTHHSTLHKIHKRSINNNNNNNINNDINYQGFFNDLLKSSHHIKKDLSKSTYSSEVKFSSISNYNSGSISRINNNSSTSNKSGSVSINNYNNNENNLDNNDGIYIRNNLNSDNIINYSEKSNLINLNNIKEHNVSLSVFGQYYNLSLKPTEGLFKNGPKSLRIWNAEFNPKLPNRIQYTEILPTNNENKYNNGENINDNNTDDDFGEIYQDVENMAAILMRRYNQTGDLIMEGSIGHDLVIKPLPPELCCIGNGNAQHIVYRRKIDTPDSLSDYAFMEPDRLNKKNLFRKRRSTSFTLNDRFNSSEVNYRSKRSVPKTIYPEILVIVDYDGYRLHGGHNEQVRRYFVSFWNGVDLRYRLLKGPGIRISIAGIIISRSRDATPYLERNRVGRDAIDSAAALTDMGKYLFRERRLPVYDIAVAITKLDMCRRLYPYGECKRGTAGFAYVGGACVVNKRLEKVNSVAIIEDTGGFSGIIVAAHEVGHLLGAVHDGSPPPSYLGGPGAERCRWEDGYIMSDLRHTEKGFRWSPCTIQSFHHFLYGDTATCLYNVPHEDGALERSLPGTLLSLDAQCRRDRGTYACFKDNRVCAQLFCFDSQTGYCVAYRPAAEGSSCGDGQHCLDGRCIQQNENAIPDFSIFRSPFSGK